MRYRVPGRVARVVTERGSVDSAGDSLRVSLLRLPDGVPVVLTDAGALIWLLAAEGSDTVVEDVAREADQPVDLIRPDVEQFLADLETQGLLVRSDGQVSEIESGAP